MKKLPRSRILALATALAMTLAVTLSGCTPFWEPKVPEKQSQAINAFQSKAKELGVYGAFLLMRTPEGEYTSAYGTTERGKSIEPTADTVFRMGSNTKTMTGTVILQLVSEGKLKLSDAASKFRPDVPNGNKITIEMLLNMRSGLFDYSTDEALVRKVLRDPKRPWLPEQLLKVAYSHPPLFAPGTKYSYSNTNTVLLAVIAQQLTGSPIDQLVTERITVPLGLKHTKLPPITDYSLESPFTHGYTYLGGTGLTIQGQPAGDPQDATFMNPSWMSAAGAGISTASELADWVEALTSGTLLTPEMQQQRIASVVPIPGAADAENWGYGLGLAKLDGLLGHNGQVLGYNSYMGSDPDRGLTVTIWVNIAPDANGKSPADLIAAEVVPILLKQ